jgi:stringent starvation protein B
MVHPVQSVVESLYDAGRCPRLHVNATCEGVVCPDHIRDQWRERLIIDLDSTYPLDLTFAEEGIGADLSFGGHVTRCTFPWKAIYVVADRASGKGIVIDQNMPESVRRSRTPPTTGPLPSSGDLRRTFEHERAKDRRVGGPSKPNRRKPKPTGPTELHPGSGPERSAELGDFGAGPGRGPTVSTVPTASTPLSSSSQPAASDNPEREGEVQRRRAAFKVIDGGS